MPFRYRPLSGFLALKRYVTFSNFSSCSLVNPQKQIDSFSDIAFSNISKRFKLILDVRSPAEFDVDHIEGAVNIPILDDRERSDVGKIYSSSSNKLPARLLGSSIVMKNLSKYLQPDGILFKSLHERVQSSEDDRILVYCWRGGQRSRAVAIVLSEIGFTRSPVHVINGGYKAYRRQVLADIETLPSQLNFVGLCGLTGTAKTKILGGLRSLGETVLDLEELAEHKGSVFGSYLKNVSGNAAEDAITVCQPSQKTFDSRLWNALTAACDGTDGRVVWVECESRNIGRVTIPGGLWTAMVAARRVVVEAPLSERVAHILAEYRCWTQADNLWATKHFISWLSGHHPRPLVDQWRSLAASGDHRQLVESLLTHHYDPLYTRNRAPLTPAVVSRLPLDRLDDESILDTACPRLIQLSRSWQTHR